MAYATLGSFVLFKEVIRDELGHLYRAGELGRDAITRTVWLRVLDGAAVPAADILGQLATARRVAEVLQAANVASGATCANIKGVPVLASDYMAAQPLDLVFRKATEEGFPVPVDNALLILEKLALGLAAAMTVEIGGTALAHGCMHPGLVLVSTDGEAQIVGFGVADQLLGMLDDAGAGPALAPYLAPEVLVTRTASKRGDVYSLGSILFELLTGAPLPADPGERAGILDRAELSYDERPIPDDIKVLLSRALAARPEERFSSAADFKKELDKLLYGGNYSPTTFNLALFMDRLFRSEIEAEERERLQEAAIDLAPYLQPEPEPEPEPVSGEVVAAGGSRGPLIGIAVAAVVVAVVAVVMLNRAPKAPPIPPTPTAEEIGAQRQADDERLQAMVQQLVQQQMAEKEREIRTELEDRQTRIDELQKQLRDSQKRSAAGQVSATERQQQAELERQIAAAEDEQRRQQEALEAERQRLLEESRKQLEAQRAATATAVAAEQQQQLVARQSTPTPPPMAPATAPPPQPTEAPPAAVAAVPATTAPNASPPVVVTENAYIEPTQVDAPPVVLKEAPLEWSRQALRSRNRGMVIVRALVRADGSVETVEVLRADEQEMGIPESVSAAVQQYRFKPGTKNGVNIKTWATVTTRYWFRDR